MRFYRLRILLTGSILLAACGYLAEKGQEPRGNTHLPSSGVGKYLKQDAHCNAQLVQPFLVEDPAGSAWQSGAPCMLPEGPAIRMWYERRSAGASTLRTARFAITPGTACRDADALLLGPPEEVRLDPEPTRPVGAPTVLPTSDGYRMYFEVGDGESIGLAESEDGTSWRVLDMAVIAPNQAWEAGSVGSPSVLHVDGRYRMWYDGDRLGERAIGHAWSDDGVEWVKSDAAGNEADATSPSPGAEVAPVLTATQVIWEFWYPDPADPRHIGRVGEPCVIVHPTPLRRLFYMYYTGNLAGRITQVNIDSMDASIGIASSADGLTWQKAPVFSKPDVTANEINPIVDEKLPISIDPDKPDGSVNVFNPLFIVDEAAPAVLELIPDQLFVMLWHQVDAVNLRVVPNLPPEDPTQGPNDFDGASGIGFAYTGNLPF